MLGPSLPRPAPYKIRWDAGPGSGMNLQKGVPSAQRVGRARPSAAGASAKGVRVGPRPMPPSRGRGQPPWANGSPGRIQAADQGFAQRENNGERKVQTGRRRDKAEEKQEGSGKETKEDSDTRMRTLKRTDEKDRDRKGEGTRGARPPASWLWAHERRQHSRAHGDSVSRCHEHGAEWCLCGGCCTDRLRSFGLA